LIVVIVVAVALLLVVLRKIGVISRIVTHLSPAAHAPVTLTT
jgi:hypothetical protein